MNETAQKQTSENTKSVEEIRRHFPALKRKYKNFEVAYFDSPGGTQVPGAVVEAMNDYLFNHNANAHWAFPSSNETDALVAASRQTLADFLNASFDEIVFGQNMTSLVFHLARALGRNFAAGDEIVVTELDHHANIDTWRSLEKDRGIVIRVLPMNAASGQLEIEKLADLLNEKTRLVAVGAASNALGTISDVGRVCEMAREVGALSFVDAVHYAPHKLVDVKDWNCDFLACSAYKFYGPHIGILFGRGQLLETIDFPKLKPSPDSAPERAETGTQSFESIVGAAAAVDFLASLGEGNSRREKLANAFADFHARDEKLTRDLWENLAAIDGVKVYGPAPDAERTSLVSFTVKDLPAAEVGRNLSEKGIFISHGNFYAATVVEKLGLGKQGLVRAGCACYTTLEEVKRLIAGVREIAAVQ